MKPFRLFLGGRGLLGIIEVTLDPKFQLIIGTVSQLRDHMLGNPILRQPLLHLFSKVYSDDSDFPEDSKGETPLEDQISNMSNIRKIRPHPPSDEDVVTFLTDAFPDLYLEPGHFCEGDVLWGRTDSGRGEAKKEFISINVRLVHLWNKAVSTQNL